MRRWPAKEVDLAAEIDGLTADPPDRRAVVLAEVGDGFDIGRQPTAEPDQFEIALGFPLQATAGLNAVETAVRVELEERRRVVAGAAGRFRVGSFGHQGEQIELPDENFDYPNRVVFGNILVKGIRQQRVLCPNRFFNESLHRSRRSMPYA